MRIAVAALAVLAVSSTAQAAEPLVERGRYIVEQVGLCNDCHTQHNPDGTVDRTKLLQGALLPFVNTVPMPWADRAPPLLGRAKDGWTAAAFETFLQTGIRPNGTRPRPPMPEYRLNAEDARAAAAYIISLDNPMVAETR